MINKENKDEKAKVEQKKIEGFVDTARMDVQCHLMIKDKDTGIIILNKRG